MKNERSNKINSGQEWNAQKWFESGIGIKNEKWNTCKHAAHAGDKKRQLQQQRQHMPQRRLDQARMDLVEAVQATE